MKTNWPPHGSSACASFVNVPIVDSVIAGATWALRNSSLPPQRASPGFDVPWVGLSPELTQLGLH